METEIPTTDVSGDAPNPSESTDSASAPAGGDGSTPDVDATQAPPAKDDAGQAEAAFKVPENDDDLKGQENNPHVQGIVQLRQELRARDQRLDSLAPLEAWKEATEKIGDPAAALAYHEMISGLHAPVEGQPNEFTTVPFLQTLETDSPGTVDQLFSDLLKFQVPGENGQPDTLVRQLVRSWGLDPDRIDDYRGIDNLRASGIVTTDDLTKIDPKYHDAFRSMSQAAREDLLEVIDTKPLVAEESLRNAQRAMAAEKFEQAQKDREQAAQDTERVQFAQRVEQATLEDISQVRKTAYASIRQNLASQVTFSTDPSKNEVELTKIMGFSLVLLDPMLRSVMQEDLAKAGISLDAKFDELTAQVETERAEYVKQTQMGDKLQARAALSRANVAEQQVRAKANAIALQLAKASSTRLKDGTDQLNEQLGAATARYVPNGNGQVPQGSQNPYEANPHPIGSQEYYAFNRKIDREYKLDGAAVFGN